MNQSAVASVVAVEQGAGEVRGGAADADALALAELAVDDDAGDALQRFGDVLVGELADVLGGERRRRSPSGSRLARIDAAAKRGCR